MHIKQYILVITSLLFFACQKDVFTFNDESNDNTPYAIGFWVGGGVSGDTRTAINEDGQSISWEQGDKVALWALQGSSYTFQNQPFGLWFRTTDNSQAFFASTRVSSMPEGEHTYYACYPTPVSYNGTTATFTIPSVQDGKMSGGADIMVAQGDGPVLEKLYNPEAGDYLIDDGLSLNMRHLIHALRFYVPQSQWGFPENETVERIIFTMPSSAVAATGTVTADVASETAGLTMTNSGSNTISLNLREPIVPSAANANGGVSYDYAAAAIMPATYTGDLVVKVFSQTKASQVTIANVNREMQAGHITPVGLNCSTVTDRPKMSFRIASNNLGEKPYKITLTSSDSNTRWKTTDDHEYEYYTGSESLTVAEGGGFDIYYDEDVLSTISDKPVTVTYESKSAIVTETITMPSMNIGTSYEIKLNVPYLFAENFDTFGADNSHWKEKEKSGSWINGWSGNQWRTDGTNMGLCSYTGDYGYYGSITKGPRFYSTDTYFGRLDSPVLPLKAGKSVQLSIRFDISLEDEASNGYTSCKYGYSNNTDAVVGGYTSNIGEVEESILGISMWGLSVNGNEGDQELARAAMTRNMPNKIVGEATSNGNITTPFNISNTSNNIRLTWFTEINNNYKKRITSKWFYSYIDNVKVQIVSE